MTRGIQWWAYYLLSVDHAIRMFLSQSSDHFGRKKATILSCSLYITSFISIYMLHISYTFRNYPGYQTADPSGAVILLAFSLALLPALVLPTAVERPSQLMYWLLYVIVYVPSSIMPYLILDRSPQYILPFSLVFFTLFVSISVIYRLPLVRPVGFSVTRKQFMGGFFVLYSLCTIVVLLSLDLQLQIVTLTDIPDVRENYKARSGIVGRLSGYFANWLMYILNPFLMALGLAWKKKSYFALGVGGEGLLFLVAGWKTAFLFPVGIVAIYVLFRYREHICYILPTGVFFLIVTMWIFDAIFKTHVFTSILVRRFLAVPGIASGYYFDFFSTNEKTFLTQRGLFQALFSKEYPYAHPPGELIGLTYFEVISPNSVANIWSSGFSSFGYPGMVLVTIVIGVVMWLYDGFSEAADLRIVSVVLLGPGIYFSNSQLLSGLWTRGMLLLLVIILFLPRQKDDSSSF